MIGLCGCPWLGGRAYALKEALRAIFAGDLTEDEITFLLGRFCSKASRSGLQPFVTAANRIRKRKVGILAAIGLGINNAQLEGLNRRVRLIVNRAHGFHSAYAALGLIMLTLGPIEHMLPHERARTPDPSNHPHRCRKSPKKKNVRLKWIRFAWANTPSRCFPTMPLGASRPIRH